MLNGERSTRGISVHDNPSPIQRAHRHVTTVIKKKKKARKRQDKQAAFRQLMNAVFVSEQKKM